MTSRAVRELDVYLRHRRIGTLRRAKASGVRFRYVVAEHAIDHPVSVRLPVRDREYPARESTPFFDGLLPEEDARLRVATDLGVASFDTFGLLAAIGRDCAGALSIVPAGESLPRTDASVQWLDDAALAEAVDALAQHPLGLGHARVRLSLAGAQRKLVLVRDSSGRFGFPLDGAPSTHIVKVAHRDDPYPGIVLNEYACILACASAGLSTEEASLHYVADRAVLVVTRYDREIQADGSVSRVHQEDFAQVLGLTSSERYWNPDTRLPSVPALVDAARLFAEPRAQLAILDAVVASFVLGNRDLHARNLSLLYPRRGDVLSLAPLYDVVCTEAYGADVDRELAMPIGSCLHPDEVTTSAWDELARVCGLSVPAFRRRRTHVADAVVSALGEVVDVARTEGWHHEVLDRTHSLAQRHRKQV